jgi:8-oxo-dGTP pyrophosphatase MutT (NUDIX family)
VTARPADEATIRIVAALVVGEDGRTLLVRKRGTSSFMQAGGKIMAGELPIEALEREVREELGCGIAADLRPLGRFSAPAAHEAGRIVEAELFQVDLIGEIAPAAEIEQVIWVDPAAPGALPLAPLTRQHVLPLAQARRRER